MNIKTRKMTFIAIMIAMCTVLSYVPIPGYPTLSFDSTPGFLVAILINPVIGGFIALLGHIITAFIKGFPMGIASHFIIAFSMFVAAYVLGFMFKQKNVIIKYSGFVFAMLLNTYLSMPFLILLLGVPSTVLLPLQLPLMIAAACNLVVAYIAYVSLRKSVYNTLGEDYEKIF